MWNYLIQSHGLDFVLVSYYRYLCEKLLKRSLFQVQNPATNQLALDLMCGEWGSEYCTPQRWFNFMGDASGAYVPFQINYIGTDAPGFTPYDPETRACNVGTGVSNIPLDFETRAYNVGTKVSYIGPYNHWRSIIFPLQVETTLLTPEVKVSQPTID